MARFLARTARFLARTIALVAMSTVIAWCVFVYAVNGPSHRGRHQ